MDYTSVETTCQQCLLLLSLRWSRHYSGLLLNSLHVFTSVKLKVDRKG